MENMVTSELKERAITFLSKVYRYNGFEKEAMQEMIKNISDDKKKELISEIFTKAISGSINV